MNRTRRQQGWIRPRIHMSAHRWLVLLGLLALLAPGLQAQGQYDAAVEAMQPAAPGGPVLVNPILPAPYAPMAGVAERKQGLRLVRAALPKTPLPADPDAPVPPVEPDNPAPVAPTPSVKPEPLAPATGPLADAEPRPPVPLADPEQVRITADDFRYDRGATAARGNVILRYQDMTVASEAAQLDEERVWGTFQGTVNLQAPRYRALSDRLRINLETEEFSATNAAATVEPEFFGGLVVEPIYVRAAEVVGRPSRVVGTDGIGTSCNLWPDPHWMLRSNQVTVVPEDRVTFRRPELYLFGHRLFRYPWDLTLSLRRRDNRFLPEVGQNEVEGYYAKFAYGYTMGQENSGVIKLHLTTRRGVGLGFDHVLDATAHWANFSFFFEPQEGSFTGMVLHRGRYGPSVSSNLSVSFQQNSGYGFGSESLSSNLTLRHDTTRVQSALGLQHSLFSSTVGTSSRFASDFRHRQRIDTRGDWEVHTNYSSNAFTAGDFADEELNTEFNWRQDFRLFTSNLTVQKRFDIDGSRYTGDSGFYGLDRLPDLVLTTDSSRLGDWRILGSSVDATIYAGWFRQFPEDRDILRGGIDVRLVGINRDFGRSASLRTAARLRQMIYNDAAQWIGEFTADYRLRLPGHWDTRLSFRYSRPNGFAPLRLDYASPVSVMYWEAVRLVADRMRLDVSTGRDFHNDYWHDALVRAQVMLSPRNRLELQTGYSLQLSQFRPVNLRWIYATRRAWWSAITVNYDVENSSLTNVGLDIDWQPSDQWRVQFLGGFSNFGGFDQADVRITRDLHCMLAQLTYIHATGEVRLGLGIKAFPSATRTFGVGSSGQYFQSDFTDYY